MAIAEIKYLNGKIHVQGFAGLSSDIKLTTGVPPNSEYLETDTGYIYVFDSSEWNLKKG